MGTVCPSKCATRRTLFHVLVGCGLLMLKVSRLKLPVLWLLFFFSSRRRHTRCGRDWSSDVCSSDLSMTFDTKTAVDRFFEVMDSPSSIQDPEQPQQLTNPSGRLTFEGTRFRYQDAPDARSEERRVGKEGRTRGSANGEKTNE